MKRFLPLIFVLAFVAPSAVLGLSLSSIPAKFGIPWAGSAGAAYIRSIPTTSQIGITNCAASLPDGFPPLTFTPPAAGGCPPFGQDFNGVLKQITQWNQWQAAGGPVFYDSAFATSIGGYPALAILTSAVTQGTQWMSTVDNNMTNPDAGGAGWVQAPGQVPIGTPVQSLSSVVPPGYVSANGFSIGNASSGAVNRANADTQFLFAFIWNNCPNTACPIFTSGGSASTRGANAAADFAANKNIAVHNLNGASLMGADSQNGSTSSSLVGVPVFLGSTTVPGSLVGENLHTLTAAQVPTITSNANNNITANVNVSVGVSVTVNSTSNLAGTSGSVAVSGGATGVAAQSPASSNNTWFNVSSMSGSGSGTGTGSGTTLNSISVNSNNTGGGSHNIVERSLIVYWNLKL